MKRTIAIGLLLIAGIAMAGSVYQRAVVALGTTTGTATFTNASEYAAFKVTGIRVQYNTDTGATTTVSRVVYNGTTAYTNTVGTIVGLTGLNIATNPAYLNNDDLLKFASSTTTGATVIVEGEYQQH